MLDIYIWDIETKTTKTYVIETFVKDISIETRRILTLNKRYSLALTPSIGCPEDGNQMELCYSSD
jgi:hypothetical protein